MKLRGQTSRETVMWRGVQRSKLTVTLTHMAFFVAVFWRESGFRKGKCWFHIQLHTGFYNGTNSLIILKTHASLPPLWKRCLPYNRCPLFCAGAVPRSSPSTPQQSAAGFVTIRRRLADPSHQTVSSDFFIGSHRICSHPVATTRQLGQLAHVQNCSTKVRSRVSGLIYTIFYVRTVLCFRKWDMYRNYEDMLRCRLYKLQVLLSWCSST